MVQNGLTPENIVARGEALTFPDSVVSYFKGMMGQPAWGFPEDLQKVVLKGEAPITCRPGELLEPIDFEKAREEVRKFYPNADDHNIISWCLYPKVVEDFYRHRQAYGYIMRMGSHVFFNGMALGETNKINIEDGKTLVIKYLGLGDLNEDGKVDGLQQLTGAAGDGLLTLEHHLLQVLGEAPGGLAHHALEVAHHAVGEGEGLSALHNVLGGQLVLHHEDGQITHHLGGGRHLHNVAQHVVDLDIHLLDVLELVAQAQALHLALEVGVLAASIS